MQANAKHAPAKVTMADALEGIDLGEMVGILAETEPQHSQATDDVFVDLNDIISNVMTDAERSALQGKRAWLAAEDEQLRLAVGKHGTGCWKRIAREILEHVGTEGTTGMCRNRYMRITVPLEVKSKNRCTKCGQIWRGHTCSAQELSPIPSRQAKRAREMQAEEQSTEQKPTARALWPVSMRASE